jgi:hypothetical protein
MAIHVSVAAAPGDAGSGFPAMGPVLWSADNETGDLSQWTENQYGEAVFNSASASVSPWLGLSHSGKRSLQLSITDAGSQGRAARIFRWHENQSRAYYTVWYYFPQTYWPAEWWNVMQFKTKSPGGTSRPMWILNVDTRWDGSMGFYLWDAINSRSFEPGNDQLRIKTGQWTKLTVYYQAGQGQAGRITVWQDDAKLLDLSGVQTSLGGDVEWGLSNYTDSIDPSNAVIYIDDAEIRAVSN